MDNLYVYSLGIVDDFMGMMPFKAFIYYYFYKDGKEFDNCGFNLKEFLRFIEKCFFVAKCSSAEWDGDIRDTELYVGGIPRGDNQRPYLFISFKQDDSGCAFIVSECKFLMFDYAVEEAVEDKIPYDMMYKYLKQSEQLTFDVFHRDIQCSCEDHNHDNDHAKVANPANDHGKFDLNNYE